MQKVQTASWTETLTIGQDVGSKENDAIPAQFWLRTDPPALAWRNDFGESWDHTVIDGARRLFTASTWKTCQLDIAEKPITVEELVGHVLFPPPLKENHAIDGRVHVPWQQEATEREGRPVVRWHRETTQEKFHVAETVWTEPHTHRIVAKERRETDPITNRTASVEVRDHYRYNESLPPAVFEMPTGKPIVEREEDEEFMAEVWDRLPVKERTAIQNLLHRSEMAWQSGDFPAFAALWHFHIVPDVPRDTEWKERLEQQAKSGSRSKSEVISANKQDFVPITVGVNTYRWGPERRRVLRVKALLSISWGEGASWEGQTDYYVGRRGRGYRIVHWECPWEEIREAQLAAKQSP